MSEEQALRKVAFFESERLWFRAPEMSDLADITAMVNRPEVRRHLDRRVFPISEGAEKQWLENTASVSRDARSDVVLFFGLKGTDRMIGSSGLHGINWLVRAAEWGILVAPEYWNQGFGREVARRMLRYGFEELNLNRIHLRVNAVNERGVRAYRAAGYVEEGRMRQASWVDGQVGDMLLMSVLRSEWEAQGPHDG